MKKLIVVAALIAASFSALADSTGATTNWVARYVAEAISNSIATISATAKTTVTNGVTTVVIGGTTEYPVTMRCEANSVAALAAIDATDTSASLGVTNGVLWAWHSESHHYRNKDLADIIPSATNFTWMTYSTKQEQGKTVFTDNQGTKLFAVSGVLIQPSKARQVKGE